MGGSTCADLGATGGTLRCAIDCLEYDPSGCTADPFCGDGIVNGIETCDGFEFGGDSCVSQGYRGGFISCLTSCSTDYTGCTDIGPGICDPFGASTLRIPATRNDSFTGAEPTDGPRSGSHFKVYAMSLSAGRTYSITMTATGTALDTYLFLFNGANCSQVAFDDDSAGIANDSLLTYVAPTSGTYYLIATTYGTGVTGTYTLTTN